MPTSISLDTVRFDETGRAQMRDTSQPLRFQFRYRNIPFHGQIDLVSSDEARLRLTGILGSMPFTIESGPLRQTVFSLIKLADAKAPERIKLTETHRVAYVGETFLKRPFTPIDTIEALTHMITRYRPSILFFQTLLSSPRPRGN